MKSERFILHNQLHQHLLRQLFTVPGEKMLKVFEQDRMKIGDAEHSHFSGRGGSPAECTMARDSQNYAAHMGKKYTHITAFTTCSALLELLVLLSLGFVGLKPTKKSWALSVKTKQVT